MYISDTDVYTYLKLNTKYIFDAHTIIVSICDDLKVVVLCSQGVNTTGKVSADFLVISLLIQ
ncbi:hypothetical protein EMO51_01730 [Escherichia coli]|nr:hypothetical protein [Escherichia coli]